MKLSSGEEIHTAGVMRIKGGFLHFSAFSHKEINKLNASNCWMVNTSVKATTCFSWKLTVNIDFLLLREISFARPPGAISNLNFLPCSGEEFR